MAQSGRPEILFLLRSVRNSTDSAARIEPMHQLAPRGVSWRRLSVLPTVSFVRRLAETRPVQLSFFLATGWFPYADRSTSELRRQRPESKTGNRRAYTGGW